MGLICSKSYLDLTLDQVVSGVILNTNTPVIHSVYYDYI